MVIGVEDGADFAFSALLDELELAVVVALFEGVVVATLRALTAHAMWGRKAGGNDDREGRSEDRNQFQDSHREVLPVVGESVCNFAEKRVRNGSREKKNKRGYMQRRNGELDIAVGM